MSAAIIQLDSYRRGHKHAGVVFPQLYRVSGFSWEFEDPVAQTGKVAGTKWPYGPFYTLEDVDRGILCSTKFEPITRLDRDDDRGWVIVRHHANEVLLDGYMDGFSDLKTAGYDENPGAVVYRTAQGLFTCVNRPANPRGPDRLLIFVCKAPLPAGPLAGVLVDEWKIIDPSGNELNDSIFGDDEDEPEP